MNLNEVFDADNSQKKVLLYAREPIASGLLFRKYGDCIIKNYLKVENYKILSDYPKNTDFFIDLKRYSLKDFTTEDFKIFENELDIESIIKNDRTFRISLSYYDATKLIFVTAKYLIDFFKKNKFDILVTHMVDCYTVDILTRIARYFNVQIIPYCASSFGGDYIMITERGESHYVREPLEAEVDSFISFLEDKSSKPFVKSRNQVNINIFKYYFIYKVKFVWHYLILHKLFGRMEYRYLVTKSEAYPRSLNNIFAINRYFVHNLKDLPDLDIKKTVYLPLHYHPEATTEYWIHKDNYLTYYPSLFKIIKNYSERNYTVLVKEHTAMFMMRDREIYEQIAALTNVYLISPYVTTYDVLDKVEFTVLWTGTTGVEAIMTDKKVILTESETYFSFGKLSYVGNEDQAKVFSKHEKRELTKNILRTLLPIEIINKNGIGK